jgi:hypothetical protein
MSLGHSPQLAATGLVLNLDPGNTRSLNDVSANVLPTPETFSSWSLGPNSTFKGLAPGPDGSSSGFKLQGNGSGGNIFLMKTVSYLLNATYTASCWARLSSGTVPTSGMIMTIGYGNAVGAEQRATVAMNGNLTSTWQRFSVTYTSLFAGNYNAYFAADQNNTAEIEVWGMQVELGSISTPYYPASRPVTTTWKDLTSNNYNATLGISTLSSVEVLVVAGGGAGGGYHGGGGGAGGVIYNANFSVTPGTSYTVTVGAGGAAATAISSTGNPGDNSVFGTLTAFGGGAGISQGLEALARNVGGSGGGGCDGSAGVNHPGGIGVPGQGFPGGAVFGDGPPLFINYATAGGGGAGGPGTGPTSVTGGAGGPGLPYSISGSLRFYGGGGGGTQLGTGTGSPPVASYGLGGVGGGGIGGYTLFAGGPAVRVSTNGEPNTGGGGGGYLYSGLGGGAGGSGIVIVRYPGRLQKATGGIVTVVDNFTIHTFTSGTSTFVPYNFISPKYSTTAGGCLTFNGIDQIVDLNVSAYDLGIRRHATFSGWMMTNLGGAYLLSDWDNLGMTLRFNDLTSADFYVYGSNRRITAAYTFTVNVWYNIVGVMDGANMYMYINGTLVGTQTLGEDIGASPRTLKISARGDYSPPSSLQRVGSLQIYNRALSASEVTNNFNALKGRYGL